MSKSCIEQLELRSKLLGLEIPDKLKAALEYYEYIADELVDIAGEMDKLISSLYDYQDILKKDEDHSWEAKQFEKVIWYIDGYNDRLKELAGET